MNDASLAESEQDDRLDGKDLVALARDSSNSARRKLVDAVTGLPSIGDKNTTRREREIMFDILRRLVHEAEMVVRRTVSLRLSEMSDAPRDLVRLLANDKIEIAYPILTKSGALLDEDLIEVVRNRTFEHQLAVAIRSNLSDAVSDSIVETEDKNVIKCLLQNTTAQISRSTMAYLVEQSEREDIFREPLVRRSDLDRDLAERMFGWVSQTLRQIIIKDWNLDEKTVNRLLVTSSRKKWSQESDAPEHRSKAKILTEQLLKQGLLTQNTLLRVLKNGDVALFTAMFGQLTGLTEPFVLRILYDNKGTALAAACKFAKLNKDAFRVIYNFARQARKTQSSTERNLRRALQFYDRKTPLQVENIVHHWQRHPNPTGMWDLGLN